MKVWKLGKWAETIETDAPKTTDSVTVLEKLAQVVSKNADLREELENVQEEHTSGGVRM